MPTPRRTTTDEPESTNEAQVTEASPEPQAEGTDAENKETGFYCPGCGQRYSYQRQCEGRPEAPHAPIEVVSVDELGSDHETAAPNTDVLG